MLKALFLLLFMAAVFGLCFLVDKLCARIRQRAKNAPSVRPPLRYPVLAVLLALASIGCGIYGALEKNLMFLLAAAVLLGLGVYFVIYYRSTGITYTDRDFTFRSGKTRRTFPFGDIEGQRVAVSRGSVCLVLCLGVDEVVLYSHMQGFRPFLDRAFRGWCHARGLDPAGQDWYNPENHQWFPDQPGAEKED